MKWWIFKLSQQAPCRKQTFYLSKSLRKKNTLLSGKCGPLESLLGFYSSPTYLSSGTLTLEMHTRSLGPYGDIKITVRSFLQVHKDFRN